MDLLSSENTRPSCAREILARSPIGSIERCTCGAIHLAIGALSLRLDALALQAIVVMGREALDKLEEHRVRLRVPSSRGTA